MLEEIGTGAFHDKFKSMSISECFGIWRSVLVSAFNNGYCY